MRKRWKVVSKDVRLSTGRVAMLSVKRVFFGTHRYVFECRAFDGRPLSKAEAIEAVGYWDGKDGLD